MNSAWVGTSLIQKTKNNCSRPNFLTEGSRIFHWIHPTLSKKKKELGRKRKGIMLGEHVGSGGEEWDTSPSRMNNRQGCSGTVELRTFNDSHSHHRSSRICMHFKLCFFLIVNFF
mmetsp:Transcript_739/g.1041  ORF Transcript_739/g.1041 Transcript_739/m.1041 type:complete len:115 (+) Transcript_739:478-822(+)